jgi:hypothetical protein
VRISASSSVVTFLSAVSIPRHRRCRPL